MMAMYEAMKAALDPRGPQPCPWDQIPQVTKRTQPAPTNTIDKVVFVGERDGALFKSLYALGVPLAVPSQASDAKVLVIDGETVNEAGGIIAQHLATDVLQRGGLVWVMIRNKGAALPHISTLLPGEVTLTDRFATMLVPGDSNPVINGFNLSDLYFAGEAGDNHIQKAGIDGPLVQPGHVLVSTSNTDWSLFERQSEAMKCGAMLIYERLKKPAGTALLEVPQPNGRLWISTLDTTPHTPAFNKFWTQLWQNLRVKITKPIDNSNGSGGSANPEHNLLLNEPTQ